MPSSEENDVWIEALNLLMEWLEPVLPGLLLVAFLWSLKSLYSTVREFWRDCFPPPLSSSRWRSSSDGPVREPRS